MADRKVFNNSIVPLPLEGTHPALGLVIQQAQPFDRDRRLTLNFAFHLPTETRLDLEASIAKGEVVPIADQDERYRPSQDDVGRLQEWLVGQGFKIESVERDGLYASAPASAVATALHVDMVQVTRDGFTGPAARNAPSLPDDVGATVGSIGGLQPFIRLHRHSRMRSVGSANVAEAAGPAPAVAGFLPPYLLDDLRRAYGAEGIQATGAGQTIAILIDAAPNMDDIAAFAMRNGVTIDTTRVDIINVRGGALPPPEGEETLDVSWSAGMATGARIAVYCSGSLAFVDLDLALDRIITDAAHDPSIRQLSISLGLGEQYMGPSDGEATTQHDKFIRLASAGVNVFVSSGDAGSNPDETGHSSGGATQAEHPASDPYVIAVGGTSLRMAIDGSVASETGWAGSGGGTSKFFPRAPWQAGASIPNMPAMRLVPDVSIAADPQEGAYLVFNGRETQTGGTSWGAPVWAAFCAILNEHRLSNGKAPAGFLGPQLYAAAGSAVFRDITDGSNGQYSCAPGYDQVTGLGVPMVAAFLEAMT